MSAHGSHTVPCLANALAVAVAEAAAENVATWPDQDEPEPRIWFHTEMTRVLDAADGLLDTRADLCRCDTSA